MTEPIEVAQVLCPQCAKEVDADARFCKYCAFDLTTPQTSQNSVLTSEIDQVTRKSTRPLIVGVFVAGVVVLILVGVVGLFAYFKLRGTSQTGNSNSSQAPAILTLSAKGLKAEEKILRGEALDQSDIDGLTIEELRIVRNVHFARYGRKYERPGLGDYFYTRPWYKPNDNYSDSMINATDKANISLILLVEKSSNTGSNSTVTSGQAPSATPTPENSSSSGSLTNSNVQNAVNSFMSEFTKGGSIFVEGVQELPNQNAATADLRFARWVCSTTYEGGLSKQTPPPVTKDRYGMPSSTFGLRLVTYNTIGLAALKRYNDGRWVLKQVRVGNGFNAVTLNGTTEVK